MPSRHSEEVSNKVEALCAQGCTQVKQLLEDVKSGKNITELAMLSDADSQQVIDELAQIMSIYHSDTNC